MQLHFMTFHHIPNCPRGLYLICYCYWCWIWFLNYLGELLKAFWAAQHCVIEVFASSINATKCENIKMSLLPITAKYHNLLLVVVVWKYILSENTRFLNSIEVLEDILCVVPSDHQVDRLHTKYTLILYIVSNMW